MKFYARFAGVGIITFLIGFLGYTALMNDLAYRNLRAEVQSGAVSDEIERYGIVTAIDPTTKALRFDTFDPVAPNEPVQSLTIDASGAIIVRQNLSTPADSYSSMTNTQISTFSDITVGTRIHAYLKPTNVLKAGIIYFGDPL